MTSTLSIVVVLSFTTSRQMPHELELRSASRTAPPDASLTGPAVGAYVEIARARVRTDVDLRVVALEPRPTGAPARADQVDRAVREVDPGGAVVLAEDADRVAVGDDVRDRDRLVERAGVVLRAL